MSPARSMAVLHMYFLKKAGILLGDTFTCSCLKFQATASHLWDLTAFRCQNEIYMQIHPEKMVYFAFDY